MQWLLPVGVVLILAGLGGSAGACYQAGTAESEQAGDVRGGPDGGVPAQQTQPGEASYGPMVVATISGLSLAAGLVLVAVGMGRWKRPVPSYTRPANPWNEQPGEKGDPPTGLV